MEAIPTLFVDKLSGRSFAMWKDSHYIFKDGIYEYPLIKWCEQYLRPTSTFVDIGAHMGTYSVLLAERCQQVIAFEASKKTYQCLQESVVANQLEEKIEVYNVALGEEAGRMTLRAVSEDGGCSSLLPQAIEATRMEVYSQEEVTVVTLDSFAHLQQVDFIKIDVEGWELEVLKGASYTLYRNHYPRILFEAWPDDWYKPKREALIRYLELLGYKVYPVAGVKNMYLASDHPLRLRYEAKMKTELQVVQELRQANKLTEAYELVCQLQTKQPRVEYDLERFILALRLRQRVEAAELYEALQRRNLDHHLVNQLKGVAGDLMQRLASSFKASLELTGLPAAYHCSSSSIQKTSEGYLVNQRVINYRLNQQGFGVSQESDNIIRTRNFLCRYDEQWKLQGSGIELVLNSSANSTYPLKYHTHIQGFEDLRLLGDHHFLATCLEYNPQSIPQLVLGTYKQSGLITKVQVLQVQAQVVCEKNWLAYLDNEEAYVIYSSSPFIRYHLDLKTGTLTRCEDPLSSIKNLPDFRGSAPPVAYDGGWLYTVHQVFYASPRKYSHRFVWVDRAFKEMKYSSPFVFEEYQVEFGIGMAYLAESDELVMSYCCQDAEATVIKVPVSQIKWSVNVK